MAEEDEASFYQDKVPMDLSFGSEEELVNQLVNWSVQPNDHSLLEQFIATTIRQVGADRGYIIRNRGESFLIEAQIGKVVGEDRIGSYPEYILRHVARTGEPVILDHATQSYYVKDPYIQHTAPCSIICMPILLPGSELTYLLYLENSQVTGVFTERSLSVLELMITRVAYLYLLKDSQMNLHKDIQIAPLFKYTEQMMEPLTNREVEVLRALMEGLSNKEIAEGLGITEATVKTHVFNIYGKLGVKRRGQAIIRAKELQIV